MNPDRENDALYTAISAQLMGPVLFVARLFVAFKFVLFGARKYLHPDNIYNLIDAHGMPGEIVYFIAPFQFFLGLAIVLGVQTRLAALGLFGFCVIAPSIFHTDDFNNWTGDLSLAGGFMLLAIYGAGPWSLEAWFKTLGKNFFGAVHKDDSILALLVVITRALIAGYFFYCGARDWVSGGPSLALVHALHIPDALAYVLASLQFAGGFSILFGAAIRWFATALCVQALLIAFIVRAPLEELGVFHESFGYVLNGLVTSSSLSGFGRDLTAAGTMLILIAFGAGPWSLDARPSKNSTPTISPQAKPA